MQIEVLSQGILGTNTYIIATENECAIVDAGNATNSVVSLLSKHQWKATYLFLTHGHYDHIFYADAIRQATGAKLVIHKDDIPFLEEPYYNGSHFFTPITVASPDIVIADGDEITFGKLTAKFTHTPGHTPGGVCIQIEDHLFSGDTLFKQSIGRTDLPGGDYEVMLETLKTKIIPLKEALHVYPGHGEQTTIHHEKLFNPYLRF